MLLAILLGSLCRRAILLSAADSERTVNHLTRATDCCCLPCLIRLHLSLAASAAFFVLHALEQQFLLLSLFWNTTPHSIHTMLCCVLLDSSLISTPLLNLNDVTASNQVNCFSGITLAVTNCYQCACDRVGCPCMSQAVSLPLRSSLALYPR